MAASSSSLLLSEAAQALAPKVLHIDIALWLEVGQASSLGGEMFNTMMLFLRSSLPTFVHQMSQCASCFQLLSHPKIIQILLVEQETSFCLKQSTFLAVT